MHIVCPWVTPKIFPDFENPAPRVREFFDHYGAWFRHADRVVLNFCTGNGDHILNYPGTGDWDAGFDWARYNCYQGTDDAARLKHNRAWTARCREGGERSGNPYCAGPSFILSEQVMTYRKLAGIYKAFRAEADRRGIPFQLLEYLEPGPEMCACEWKTKRHPEGSPGQADAGGVMLPGVLDVCATLRADGHEYASLPRGITEGTVVGDFVAGQCDAFTRDFALDGVFLGNQFGLLGFWFPEAAPPATPERRAGIARFFRTLRERMGERLVYWMDTYWPADVEIDRWAMSAENYAQLDAVMVSNFAVIVDKNNVVPNLESRLRIAGKHGGRPMTLFSFDFVDCWYAYRVYLDLRWAFEMQHQVYRKWGPKLHGCSFFANDTFGDFVYPRPLQETLDVVRGTHAWAAG
jgi:hypothetical protein